MHLAWKLSIIYKQNTINSMTLTLKCFSKEFRKLWHSWRAYHRRLAPVFKLISRFLKFKVVYWFLNLMIVELGMCSKTTLKRQLWWEINICIIASLDQFYKHRLSLKILKRLHLLQNDVSKNQKWRQYQNDKSHIVKAQMTLNHEMLIDPPRQLQGCCTL